MSNSVSRAESLELSEISFIAPELARPVHDVHKANREGDATDSGVHKDAGNRSNASNDNPQNSNDGGGHGGGPSKPINQCTKCGADKIAKSRAKGLDSLVIRFLPRRPYRCLRCYHRFWSAEPFTADKRRIWSWIILVGVIALLVVARISNRSVGDIAIEPSIQPQATTASEKAAAGAISPENLQPSVQIADGAEGSATRQAPVNVPMTKLELEQRLQVAKANSDNVTRLAEQKQTALAAHTRDTPAEMQALLRTEISYRVEQWRKAWQAGDAETYLENYSRDFVPANSIPYAVWRSQRQARVVPEKNIVLVLSEFKVEFADNDTRSTVTFNQRYVSNNFWEDTRKELVLRKQTEQWYIISEREIDG
ncbi:MAG: hypothetical protein AAF431_07990 [Pseudomonadota bacterium]